MSRFTQNFKAWGKWAAFTAIVNLVAGNALLFFLWSNMPLAENPLAWMFSFTSVLCLTASFLLFPPPQSWRAMILFATLLSYAVPLVGLFGMFAALKPDEIPEAARLSLMMTLTVTPFILPMILLNFGVFALARRAR